MRELRGIALGSAWLVAIACGGESGRDEGASWGPGLGSSPVGGADTGDEDDLDDDDPDGDVDLGPGADDGGSFDECEALTEEAQVGNAGADIIIAIDNSVSMANEIASVQANMNVFSAQIAGADVDPHVVMISGFTHNSDSGICVPAPLGSGMCPAADHNPPTYWRVGNWVGSHSALARIVQHYPDYAPTLRPDAQTHVVVVTDDSSDWSAAQFVADFTALDPSFSDFVFHAIISDGSGTYVDLVQQTGGLVGDLSVGQFQPVFDELATSVIEGATLACEYEIPAPPDGQLLDPDEVNVEFLDGQGGTLQIGRVDSAAQCANVTDGWYYDDPVDPTTILVCPQTCEGIQGFELATVSVLFGCATIPAG